MYFLSPARSVSSCHTLTLCCTLSNPGATAFSGLAWRQSLESVAASAAGSCRLRPAAPPLSPEDYRLSSFCENFPDVFKMVADFRILRQAPQGCLLRRQYQHDNQIDEQCRDMEIITVLIRRIGALILPPPPKLQVFTDAFRYGRYIIAFMCIHVNVVGDQVSLIRCNDIVGRTLRPHIKHAPHPYRWQNRSVITRTQIMRQNNLWRILLYRQRNSRSLYGR